jgi:epoxyqueuosine reductase
LDQEIRQYLISSGAALVGFADMSTVDPSVRHGLPNGISIAVALSPGIIAQIGNGPTVEYAGEYDRVNALIDEISESCAELIRAEGYSAVAGRASDLSQLDIPTLSTPLPHKTVAPLAGLGWIGRCALLITEKYGSAVRLGSVVTDAPLPVGTPVTESRCGGCSECVDACPGSAPKGTKWSLGLTRGDYYDAFACFSTAKSLSNGIGAKHPICGICIAACPWTRAYLSRAD